MSKKIIITSFLLTITIALSSFNLPKSLLTIEVTNLKGSKGSVLISLYNNAKYFPKDASNAIDKAKVSIENGKAVATFSNLPEGNYAAAILHDANNNLKMDFNIVGIPKEGYGFSNNAKGMFGPPSFEKAAFKIGAGDTKLSINATYFF